MTMHDRQLTRQIAAAWIEVQPAVYAYVAAMVSNYADADDVTQRVAVAMIDSYEQYDKSRPLLAFVLGIARHKIADFQRERARGPRLLSQQILELVEDAYVRVDQQSGEMRDALSQCVRALTGRQRQVLTMRYREDRKPAAIAELMGTQSAVISNVLARTRKALRRCIERRLGRSLDLEVEP